MRDEPQEKRAGELRHELISAVVRHTRIPPFQFSLNCTRYIPYDAHWHEQMELKYVVSGSAEIVVEDAAYTVRTGDIILINPYELHAVTPDRTSGLVDHSVNIDIPPGVYGEAIAENFRPYAEKRLRFQNVIRGDEPLTRQVLNLFLLLRDAPENSALEPFGAFILLFYALSRRHAENASAPDGSGRKHNPKISQALCYIHEHYREPIRLGDAAQACFMSPSNFALLFRQTTGETLITYVNSLRVEEAANLLTATKLSVAEIAVQTGFCDESYFGKCFRKHKGVSPTEYRRAHSSPKN